MDYHFTSGYNAEEEKVKAEQAAINEEDEEKEENDA